VLKQQNRSGAMDAGTAAEIGKELYQFPKVLLQI
jgi:hypothetical protein